MDTQLRAAEVEYENEIKKKEEYQEQLDKQNSESSNESSVLLICLELLLNVRSGVQHLADKLDFVDGTQVLLIEWLIR